MFVRRQWGLRKITTLRESFACLPLQCEHSVYAGVVWLGPEGKAGEPELRFGFLRDRLADPRRECSEVWINEFKGNA